MRFFFVLFDEHAVCKQKFHLTCTPCYLVLLQITYYEYYEET